MSLSPDDLKVAVNVSYVAEKEARGLSAFSRRVNTVLALSSISSS